MEHPLFNTIRLSRTPNGEVRFATDDSQQYWFSFRHLDRCLSGDDFHRFHHTLMQAAPACQRPTCFTHTDICELRTLLGMAALMVCTLSKAYNELN